MRTARSYGHSSTADTAPERRNSARRIAGTASPESGSMRGLRQYAKAVSFKNGLCLRRGQKRKILGCVGLCVLGHRHRIDDRRMRVFRKHADDLDARIDLRVGLIDDAERRLAVS